MAPQATGAVLAIRLRHSSLKRFETKPDHERTRDCHGAPKPAQPSMNAPKQNATSRSCSRRSGVICRDGLPS